jgi:FkbM family methyltransferase
MKDCMDLKMAFKIMAMNWGKPIKECGIGNYSIEVDTREGIQRGIFLECFEQEETKWFYEILEPGMTFVDAGASFGYFTFLASSLVGKDGKVYSFEPSEYPYKRVLHNIKKNGIFNITLLNIALGEKEWELELYSADNLPTNIYNIHSPSFLNRKDQQPLKLGYLGTNLGFKMITSLDSFCDRQGVSFIDLMKIDVEGFEMQVILGMKETLLHGKVGKIMIEYNENVTLFSEGSESKRIDDILTENGFKIIKSKFYITNTDERYGNFLYELKEKI